MVLPKRLLSHFLYLFLSFLLLYNSGTAQHCTPVFHKTYHGSGQDEALDIYINSDKGSIVAGRTTTNSAKWDGFLLRLNEQGDIIWTNSYGGSEYDELTKVRQTTDGGFIALGKTRSFGVSTDEAWIIKTDGNGNLLWSKRFGKNNQPIRPKHVIELTGGGYAFAFNMNDSTAQGDGIIIRTDASGQIIWTKVFDNGGDDGINTLYQDGSNLLVGGYGTISDREGILMRLLITDGSVVWAKKFARQLGLNDEIIQVEKTSDGLAFGASSSWIKSSSNVINYHLTLFKTVGDDSIYVQRRIQPGTSSGYSIESVQLRSTNDGAFIYLVNDTTPTGWPAFRKMSPAGLSDWGRENRAGYGQRRLKGFDLSADNGYMFAGYYKDFFTGNNSRIQVLKTDHAGKNGSCTGTISPNSSDTTNYIIGTFSWNNITSGLSISDVSPVVNALAYTLTTLCSDSYCVNPDPPKATICYATLLSHIKGDGNYSFTPFDFEKVSDGYVIFGYNRLFWNLEPMMIKVQPDGTVLWAKTLTPWISDGLFQLVLPTSDGNLLVKGRFGFVINHGGSWGSTLMKITPDGKVLWTKAYTAEIYDLKPGANGSLVGTMTTQYGFPPIEVTLFKMDADGNITWQKQMNKDYDQSPIFRTIQHDGTNFYAAGEFYNQFPQNISIQKVDNAGNRLWSKVFRVEGFPTSVGSMYTIRDSLYLLAYYWDNSASFWSKKRLAVIRIGKDGNGMTVFKLSDLDLVSDDRNYPYTTGQLPQIVTKTHDDNFVIADKVSNGADSSIVITKFTPSGQIIWSKRYDQLKNHFISRIKDDNGSLMFLGRRYTGEKDMTHQFETLLMRTDNNGLVIENGTGYCHTVPNSVRVDPAKFTEAPWYNPPPISDGQVESKTVTLLERFFTMNVLAGCSTIGDCSTIDINGQQTVCSTADTVVYQLKRNAGCTIAPVWKYDPTAVTFINSTDSTLTVKFIKGGGTTITATISSGCGVISDTIMVSIPSRLMSLDLGKDTSICTGTSIVLNAHKGYVGYEWQDGTVDSTFTVRTAGTYHVKVIDSCGKITRDTILITSHLTASFNVGVDRVKCNNDTIHIKAPSGFINYSWSPSYNISTVNSKDVVVNPSSDTAYFVRAEQIPGCYVYDTVRVMVNHSPLINLGNDTSFCQGNSVTLDAGSGFNSYQWNTGSSNRSITINNSGSYQLAATTNEGCTSFDTLRVISVWPLPNPALDQNTELCQSSSRLLDPGNFQNYLWQDGSRSKTFSANTVGDYYVVVTDNNGCINGDTTRISTILPSPANFLPGDDALCSYGTMEIKTLQSYNNYLWSSGGNTSKITVDKPGSYWLQVRDGKGCLGTDTIKISLKDCMTGLRVPNAFTPNNDRKNDVFRAQLFGNVKSFEFTIYNRWGQVIFKTNDRLKGWNGKIAGIDQNSDVFVWTCKYQLEGEGEKFEKGTVILIH